MEVFARQKVLEMGDDAEDAICSMTPTLNRNDLRNATQGKFRTVFG